MASAGRSIQFEVQRRGTEMIIWSQLEGLFFLLLLGTMIYAAVAYDRVRGGAWPRVFGWSALLAFITKVVLMGAEVYPASFPSQLMPNLPIDYEVLDLIGSLAELLHGGALLLCGIALVYLGWLEGKLKKGRGRGRKSKPSRKRA